MADVLDGVGSEPVITRIEPASRTADRWAVYVEGEILGTLPRAAVDELGLLAGRRVPPEKLEAIRSAAGRTQALDAALRYLSHRPRSRVETERHLRRRGHRAEHADLAVSRCRELGYIDDESYALAYARDSLRLRPRGRVRIVSELARRGVEADTADRAVTRALEEEGVTESELLRAAARRRAPALDSLDAKTARRRLGAYLARRGFPAAEVRAVVSELVGDRRNM